MRLVYFAWVRERIGRSEEELTPPDGVDTVADLLGWLRTRGAGYEHALAQQKFIRVAIDHTHVDHEARLGSAREVALFPPMTGG